MLLNCGVGEDSLENPLDFKEVQLVHPKGDQSWVFIGKTNAKAETPILCPPHAKSWLIGKDSDAGRDWGQEEKGMTKDEMAGWHHGLDECESEWTLGVGDGQAGLACCNSWSHKESEMTERLNWTELKQGDNIQPWRTPFPIWNQSVGPCPVLTLASWPAYRFLKRHVWWSSISISFRIYHSLLWSTQAKALA